MKGKEQSSRLAALPLWLATGAAAFTPVSIFVAQILLGAAAVALLVRRDLMRLPPVWLPAIFLLFWTVVSMLASEDPVGGMPQFRKLAVWLQLLVVVFSAVRTAWQARGTLVALASAGAASAAWSMVEFYQRYSRALERGEDFYAAYVGDRITGFMSHWMTFSAHMMLALLVLLSLLLFDRGRRIWIWGAPGALVALALLLGFTRSVWVATAVGVLYLIWCWRRLALLALPIAAALILVASPPAVQTRVRSLWSPDNTLDSNQHRLVLLRTGWRMMLAHPLTGVGPEQVQRNFLPYVPEDVPKPLPSNWYLGHLHNVYLQYGAERGMPALAALLFLFGRALWDFRAALRRLPPGPGERRFVLHAATACMIGALAGGWGEHNLGDSEVLASVLAVMGLGYSAAREEPCKA